VTGKKPREIAVSLLLAREKGEFVEALLDQKLQHAELKPEDRRFLQELVYGVARWQLTLDWLIAQRTANKPQKPVVQNLLRLALYQMFWLDRVPSYAAVNETVEICKGEGLVAQSRFVNAVLRGYSREAAETKARLDEFRRDDLSLGFSHPAWLCERWQARYGKEQATRLLEWNNSPPPSYARLNELKASAAELRAAWRDEGVDFTESSHEWIPSGTMFRLNSHPPLAAMSSFARGWFYIQDPSTLLAPMMLKPLASERVLDLCAAPGGKSTYIAQLQRNSGLVQAEDLDPARLRMVEENAARLGATTVSARRAEKQDGFDRVLVDAPCSNTGVMRRRVELRWRIQPEEIHRLAKAQIGLLRIAASRVKSHGVIVYSTCSLEREENGAVAREFLALEPRFRLDEERELTPMKDGVDGAYCARIVAAG
jgi:16S rRNA (cytosine967-C5)-methyltransferase